MQFLEYFADLAFLPLDISFLAADDPVMIVLVATLIGIIIPGIFRRLTSVLIDIR